MTSWIQVKTNMSERVYVKKSEIERLSNAINELGLDLKENVKVRGQLNNVVKKLQSENKELKEENKILQWENKIVKKENEKLNSFGRNDILDLKTDGQIEAL